jgi:hypothetical protein
METKKEMIKTGIIIYTRGDAVACFEANLGEWLLELPEGSEIRSSKIGSYLMLTHRDADGANEIFIVHVPPKENNCGR